MSFCFRACAKGAASEQAKTACGARRMQRDVGKPPQEKRLKGKGPAALLVALVSLGARAGPTQTRGRGLTRDLRSSSVTWLTNSTGAGGMGAAGGGDLTGGGLVGGGDLTGGGKTGDGVAAGDGGRVERGEITTCADVSRRGTAGELPRGAEALERWSRSGAGKGTGGWPSRAADVAADFRGATLIEAPGARAAVLRAARRAVAWDPQQAGGREGRLTDCLAADDSGRETDKRRPQRTLGRFYSQFAQHACWRR